MADEIYLSPLVHVFKQDTATALFHSLRLRKIYGNSFLERLVTKVQHNPNYQEVVDSFGTNEKERVTTSIDHLIERGFITTSKQDDNLAEVLKADQKPISPTTLRLLITNGCNFSCTYCQIERNLPKRDNTRMDQETVNRALDLLRMCSPLEVEKTVIITGGEPLLAFDLLKYVVEKTSEKIDKYRVVLFTNGSLITPERAEYFQQNHVLVLVSLDGFQIANDRARLYPSQRGTFSEVMRGYNFCKSAGCEVGISAVLGKHNVSEVPDIVDYFINLGVRSIGLNFPHYLLNIDNPELIPMEEYTTHIINSFKRCRETGVFLENSSRPLGSFVENKLRLRECSALGKGITVNPYGVVGTCKTLITAGVIDKDIKQVENVNSDTTFLE